MLRESLPPEPEVVLVLGLAPLPEAGGFGPDVSEPPQACNVADINIMWTQTRRFLDTHQC
jgi:hypothetical protein